MKKIAVLVLLNFICVSIFAQVKFETDFQKAKRDATEKRKLILLNFSGSDWCGPCMQMRKDFFENAGFQKMADSCLVLVNADFPQKKKNKPAADIQEQNNALAELYNKEGSFPYTVLLNMKGEVIAKFNGKPKYSVQEFITILKKQIDNNTN